MIRVIGKYGEADIFASQVDAAAMEQIRALCGQPFAQESKIRIMPDVHSGNGCVIGLTMTVKDSVCPNLVGEDIGCGVAAAELNRPMLDVKKLDWVIWHKIQAGHMARKFPHRLAPQDDLEKLRCLEAVDMDRARLSVGTLGGGNHFIELDQDERGKLWLLVHSGSRHLGAEVARHYQKLAYSQRVMERRQAKEQAIGKMKRMGRERDIPMALAAAENATEFSKPLAWASGEVMEDYLHDMEIVQAFAMANRWVILHDILYEMGWKVQRGVDSVHNYIDGKSGILRKGAVSARNGKELIIPLNMRDGALLCVGKGNPEWNESAPHGAGRRMSRKAAKEGLAVEEFQRQMDGIYSTSIGPGTLDESPMAYKPTEDIIQQLEPTAEIVRRLRPVYCFKAEGRR